MSKLWFTESGKLALCDNGKVALSDDCPCGCPPFEGRPIIYVDKHAGGTGDGSSWTNAYTNIQAAINAHPKKEIQIQGYGETDYYPHNSPYGKIILKECTYLKGIGDVWTDGIYGIMYVDYTLAPTRIESINTISGKVSATIARCMYVYNCTARGAWSGYYYSNAFTTCKVVDGCTAYDVRGWYEDPHYGFTNCETINNSRAIDCDIGFGVAYNWNKVFLSPIATNCTAENVRQGFAYRNPRFNEVTMINCSATKVRDGFGFSIYNGIVNNCTAEGFWYEYCTGFYSQNSVLTSCSATNFANCGFIGDGTSSYIDCSESGNCTSGNPYCTHGNPNYNCEV